MPVAHLHPPAHTPAAGYAHRRPAMAPRAKKLLNAADGAAADMLAAAVATAPPTAPLAGACVWRGRHRQRLAGWAVLVAFRGR